MTAKKYYFYEKDLNLQKILDELQNERVLSDVIHNILLNGVEREIKRRKKNFERLARLYGDEKKIKKTKKRK